MHIKILKQGTSQEKVEGLGLFKVSAVIRCFFTICCGKVT